MKTFLILIALVTVTLSMSAKAAQISVNCEGDAKIVYSKLVDSSVSGANSATREPYGKSSYTGGETLLVIGSRVGQEGKIEQFLAYRVVPLIGRDEKGVQSSSVSIFDQTGAAGTQKVELVGKKASFTLQVLDESDRINGQVYSSRKVKQVGCSVGFIY